MPTSVTDPEKRRPPRRRPPGRVAREPRAGAATSEELRSIRDALRAAASGDFAVRLPARGAAGDLLDEVATAFNTLAERHESFVGELGRVSRRLALDGHLAERAGPGASAGAFRRAIESVNALLDATSWPLMETNRVLELLADGDVSREMPLFAVTSFLERFGVDVIAARSGREALDVFRAGEHVDLVLMDARPRRAG